MNPKKAAAVEEIRQAITKIETELAKEHPDWYVVHDFGAVITYTSYDGAAAAGIEIKHPF